MIWKPLYLWAQRFFVGIMFCEIYALTLGLDYFILKTEKSMNRGVAKWQKF